MAERARGDGWTSGDVAPSRRTPAAQLTRDRPIELPLTRPGRVGERRGSDQLAFVLLLLFALLACGFAVARGAVEQHRADGVLSGAFAGGDPGLFFLAGADFVGAMQLMIYVGGTLVLLIFGVMLTAKGPFISMKTSAGEWILAAIVGGSLLAVLMSAAFSVASKRAPTGSSRWPAGRDARSTATPAGHGPVRRARRQAGTNPTPLQRGGMSGYLLPFEIVSVHLLVVLIGAAYLARPKKRAWRSAQPIGFVEIDEHRVESADEPIDRNRLAFRTTWWSGRSCSSPAPSAWRPSAMRWAC